MRHTLLLADDSVTIQRVIELTFADEDIEVVSVGDGQQAIDRIRAVRPDIVLADTGMPELDGYEVAAFIKADPALASIPVVLLTGAFEPVDGDRARKAGCDAVLVKPFEPQVVIKRVRELLGTTTGPGPAESDTPSGSTGGWGQEPDPGLPPGFAPRSRPAEALAPDETVVTRLPAEDDSAAPTGDRLGGEDDPLGVYADLMDAALDRLETGETAVEPAGGAAPPAAASEWEGDLGDLESLEGALSALEGALDNLSVEPADPAEEDAAANGEAESFAEPPEPPEARAQTWPWPSEPERVPEPAWSRAFETASELVPGGGESTSGGDSGLDAGGLHRPLGLGRRRDDTLSEPTPLAETIPLVEEAEAPPPVDPWSGTVVEPAVPPAPAPPRVAPPVAPAPAPPRVAPPSLGDAFASLLAAEQGDAKRARNLYPWPVSSPPVGLDEELIERVTERVVARLSDTVTSELVTQIVAGVTERLVRAELDRQKK